ncbi:hypothetical protein CU254_32705 [Amycolatopsis sp. AA4]|nr:hypothetical protein CU254_32705 [Amycolatopsis sp. AA4]
MALGASDAPNATLGASHAPNATLGRYPLPPPRTPLRSTQHSAESRKTAASALKYRGHPDPPPTPIRSLPAVRGCLSRHLSRLDKHPRTVSTINLRGAPRNPGGDVARQGDEPKRPLKQPCPPASEPSSTPKPDTSCTDPQTGNTSS